MNIRPCLTVFACLALAACNDTQPAPTPEPVETEPEELQEDQASIIRADIEIARTTDVEPVELTLTFGDSGSELSAEAVTALTELLESLQVSKFGGTITVRGHSDAGGNDTVNLRISRERAETVAEWLVEKGVSSERIEIIAFGEQNPIEPNALPDGTPNEKGRAANRRAEVHVAVPEGASIPTPAEPTAPPADGEETGSLLRPAAGN